jgi:hypothetical protein
MALIKFGAIVSEARGKESGIIFSRNSFGSYIKQKVSPVNPQTSFQQEQRALLGTNAQAWGGLTEGQRDSWKQFGQQMLRVNRFGDQTYFTGFSAFIKTARNRSLSGLSPLTTPVSPQAFPSWTITPIVTTAILTIDFTPTPLGAGFALAIDATPPILTGRRFVKNFYRLIKVSATNPTDTVDIETEYIARFGRLAVVGEYVAIRVRIIDTLSGWDTAYAVEGIVVAS